MDQQQQSRWQPTRRKVLWAVGIAALAFLVIVICSYLFEWKWTGLSKRTFWDWLQLLIVPIVLAVGGYLFTRSENRATRTAAEQRAQDEALQAYLDQMAQMLLDKDRPLRRSKEGDEERILARARTLTVLRRLDGERKGRILQFLHESRLIIKDHSVLPLWRADLSRAELRYADLHQANLSEVDLSGADLSGARLTNTDLRSANIRYATLTYADLSNADLRAAHLQNTNLSYADLSNADISNANFFSVHMRASRPVGVNPGKPTGTDLSYADLKKAVLKGAVLSGADLTGANVTPEQLSSARLLRDATMPDGQMLKSEDNPSGPTFEEWLNSKSSGKE